MIRRIVALLALAALTSGCSSFGGFTQEIQVRSLPIGAEVRNNGEVIGYTPMVAKVKRNKDLHLTIEKDWYVTEHRSADVKMSGYGTADLIIGIVLFFPNLFGLALPGAWELDEDTFNARMRVDHNAVRIEKARRAQQAQQRRRMR